VLVGGGKGSGKGLGLCLAIIACLSLARWWSGFDIR
jgi:hypothetical protein